jgi:hypothetical protein
MTWARKIAKAIVGIPAITLGVAGLLLTILGLGFITLGKYLVLLVDD